jgi:hypothetical protein
MIGMSFYSLLLAVPACLLVRFGGVWEDVRTVLLLVVLMFLATSVTFDETFARNPGLGICCAVGGLMFAVALSAVMLRAMRLVLPGWFAVTYYLSLSLFFLYPVALVPLVDRPRSEVLQWALFGFSPVAGLVALTLLPAIRRGRQYVANNGSPWRWPLYPWSLFVFLGVGAAGRSFLLCWSMQHVERSDPEPLIFGPYFLVPLLLAVAVLLLELGLVERSPGALRAALLLPAGLVFLTLTGERPDELYQGFLRLFSQRLGGTPFYLTVFASASFYAYAWWRGVPRSQAAFVAALAALAFVAPATRDLDGLVAPRPLPLVALAAVQLGLGVRRRQSWRCVLGTGCLWAAALGALAEHPHRTLVGFHLAMAATLVLGAAFDDALGRLLRLTGVVLVLLGCVAVLPGQLEAHNTAPAWMVAYTPGAAVLLAGYGWLLRHQAARVGAALALVGWLVTLGWGSYDALRRAIAGLDFIAIGLLLLAMAELISLAKAGLLPWRMLRKEREVPSTLD